MNLTMNDATPANIKRMLAVGDEFTAACLVMLAEGRSRPEDVRFDVWGCGPLVAQEMISDWLEAQRIEIDAMLGVFGFEGAAA